MLIIKRLRKERFETQADLAKAIGVSLRTIQHYEAEQVTIPSDKLKLIAQHFNVDIPQLYDGYENSENVVRANNEELMKLATECILKWDELMKIESFKTKYYLEVTKTLNMDIDEIFAKVLKK